MADRPDTDAALARLTRGVEWYEGCLRDLDIVRRALAAQPERTDTDAALAAVERIDDARLAWASDPEINRADLADDLADALAFYLPKIRRALAAQPERVEGDPDLRRNCPVCRKPQEGSYAGVPGDKAARVYWHADGSRDSCQPERAAGEPPDAELVAAVKGE